MYYLHILILHYYEYYIIHKFCFGTGAHSEFNRVFAFLVFCSQTSRLAASHSLQRQHILAFINANRSIPLWNNLSASNRIFGPCVEFFGQECRKKDLLYASLVIISLAELLVCHQCYVRRQITFVIINILYISVRLLSYIFLSLIHTSYG